MSYNLLLVTEPPCPSWVTVTSTFKTTVTQLICTINSPSFTRRSNSTSCTMPNACTRLVCTWKLRKWLSRLKTKNTQTGFSSCRLLSNMNLRRLLMPSHWFSRCLLIHQKPLLLKDACYTRKKSMRKQELSSRKLWTKQDTSVILPITLHYVTTRWSS